MNDTFTIDVQVTGEENLDLMERVHPMALPDDSVHLSYTFPRALFTRTGEAHVLPLIFAALARTDTKLTLSDPVEEMIDSEKEMEKALAQFRLVREAVEEHERKVWRNQTFKLIDMIAGAWAKKKGIITPFAKFEDCARMLEEMIAEEPHFVHEGI